LLWGWNISIIDADKARELYIKVLCLTIKIKFIHKDIIADLSVGGFVPAAKE
jgi:hypothetical protein